MLGEVNNYLTPKFQEHMVVDTSLGQQLKININMTFHALTCQEVTMWGMSVNLLPMHFLSLRWADLNNKTAHCPLPINHNRNQACTHLFSTVSCAEAVGSISLEFYPPSTTSTPSPHSFPCGYANSSTGTSGRHGRSRRQPAEYRARDGEAALDSRGSVHWDSWGGDYWRGGYVPVLAPVCGAEKAGCVCFLHIHSLLIDTEMVKNTY